jgi:hypothetical protein
MNFIKNLKINSKDVKIEIKSNYYKNKNNLIFFGNPIHKNLDQISINNIEKEIHHISGYFLCINLNINKFFIYNDILGNFRLYLLQDKKKITITNHLKLDKKKLTLNLEELELWKKKNYTTGSATFYNEITKFPPATKSFFVKKNILHKIYFDKNKETNQNSLDLALKNLLNKNLEKLKNYKRNILLFSGGNDSSLIAQELLIQRIKFIPICLISEPESYESKINYYNANKICEKNKLILKVIKVNFNKKINYEKIINNMLFDFHLSILHFEGIKIIKKIYGKNINIICGQGADSILSYGASSNTLSHFVSRLSFFYDNIILNFFLRFFLRRKYSNELIFFNIPYEIRFFFSFYYYALIDKELFCKTQKIQRKILNIKKKFLCKKEFIMYLKIYGFLQGSDNQVVIKSCNSVGIDNVYMPFCDPQIIYAIINKKNNFKDIFFPKYVIKELLNNNFTLSSSKNMFKDKKLNNTFTLKSIETSLKKKFFTYINQYIIKNKYE